MVFRDGFVTNSSSSSFVLTFKDDAEFMQFKDECEEFYYPEVLKLILRCIERDVEDGKTVEDNRQEARDILYSLYTFDESYSYIQEKLKDFHYENWNERCEKEKEIKESQEYKDLINNLLENDKYKKNFERIENDEIVVTGMIWDTSGGLLEWAIRQGLLQREFYKYTRAVLNVG